MRWELGLAPVAVEPTSPLIDKILSARGIVTPEQRQNFLSPKLKDLSDPLKLKGLPVAVERLLRAFIQKEKIAVYADFDLDGTSGLALLKTGLSVLGFENVLAFQPRRLREGYGLHAESIEMLHAEGVKAIVTVDVGITGNVAATRARELGIDLIITDHHLPGPTLPDALTIVNPNQGDCPSGLGYLSGAGVAFYLLMAVARELRQKNLLSEAFDPKSVLDFFVIGTLTDLVPVIADNRVLIQHGLRTLQNTRKPGLYYLMQQLGLLGRNLSSQDIGFKLAPKLNALSRLDGEVLPIDIFLADTDTKAIELVTVALKSNETRKELQATAEETALTRAKEQSARGFVWVFDESFHKGVIGLVATKIAQTLGVPAFVGSVKDGVVAGSARAPEGTSVHLVEAMQSAAEALTRFGGHQKAAGFELKLERVQDFDVLLADYFEHLSPATERELQCDIKCGVHEFTSEFCKWYEFLEPFGTQFKAPVFWLENVRVREAKLLRGGHLKLQSFINGDQLQEGIWFSPPIEDGTLAQLNNGATFDVAGTVDWNHFNGRKRLQLMVLDLKIKN